MLCYSETFSWPFWRFLISCGFFVCDFDSYQCIQSFSLFVALFFYFSLSLLYFNKWILISRPVRASNFRTQWVILKWIVSQENAAAFLRSICSVKGHLEMNNSNCTLPLKTTWSREKCSAEQNKFLWWKRASEIIIWIWSCRPKHSTSSSSSWGENGVCHCK